MSKTTIFAKIGDRVLAICKRLKDFRIKTLLARVERIDKFDGMAILTLKLEAKHKFNFHAGQYIDILAHGKYRSYSIASSPTVTSGLEIHVRYRPGGLFYEYVSHELQAQDTIQIRGPFGKFQLSNTNLPILLVCTGTGFAPIKAILQYIADTNTTRDIHVYWGNRHVANYYMLDLLYSLQKQLGFKLTLCLSGKPNIGYKTGRVTQIVKQDFTNLVNYEVYACGNLNMIKDLYELCHKKLGLLGQNFFSDAFTPSVG